MGGLSLPLAATPTCAGDVFINATNGAGALAALRAVGPALDGKVVIDTSNPLDASPGFPPSLFVSNTDSLAEQLQRALPQARLVKMFNTMANEVMINPGAAEPGVDDLRRGQRRGRPGRPPPAWPRILAGPTSSTSAT